MEYGMVKNAAFRLIFVLCAFLALDNCGGSQSRGWDDIDYSKVRDRDTYENDGNYTQPTVISCTSDDLYTCN